MTSHKVKTKNIHRTINFDGMILRVKPCRNCNTMIAHITPKEKDDNDRFYDIEIDNNMVEHTKKRCMEIQNSKDNEVIHSNLHKYKTWDPYG